MLTTIEALFDGKVFIPETSVALRPNTRVRLVIEDLITSGQPGSFLQTALALQLEGPPDWASDLDAYLTGQKTLDGP